MLERFLPILTQDLALEEIPQKDKHQQFVITLNPTLVINLEEKEDTVVMRSVIGALPEKNQEEFCLFAMKGNFLGQGTGDGVIGLEENEKFLTLSSVFTYDMDYTLFKTRLESFANFVNFWQEELEDFTKRTMQDSAELEGFKK